MLSNLFKDNMVLKAGEPFWVWGRTAPLTRVTVALGNIAEKSTMADVNGDFRLEFGAVAASFTPYVIAYVGEDGEQTVRNVRFGMVFLASGQSNMEYAVKYTVGVRDYVKDMGSDVVVMRTVDHYTDEDGGIIRPYNEMRDLHPDCRYVSVGDDHVAELSAIGAAFGVYLSKRFDMPVAIIDNSVGGTPITSFIKRDALLGDEELKEYYVTRGYPFEEKDYNGLVGGDANRHMINGAYNESIAPLMGFKVNGMIWYQGETEILEGIVDYYPKKLSMMVDGIRSLVGDMPVLCVELADFFYHNLKNGAQIFNTVLAGSVRGVDNAYSVPIYDIKPIYAKEDMDDDSLNPIHPSDKLPIAIRLGEWMSCIIEGVDTPAVDPEITEGGDGFVLRFDEPIARGEYKGFFVQDSEGRFFSAEAKLRGPDTLVVYNRYVRSPKGVGYAYFESNEWCNVRTLDGAPVRPFAYNIEGNYTPVVAFECVTDDIVTNSGNQTYNGGRAIAPSWRVGTMLDNTATTLRLKDGVPVVKGGNHQMSRHYFSVSPELNLLRGAFRTADYGYMYLTVTAFDDGASFYGINVSYSDGTRQHYQHYKAESMGLPLKKGRNIVKIDLSLATNSNSVPEPACRESVRTMDFVFRSAEGSKLKILGVTLGKL